MCESRRVSTRLGQVRGDADTSPRSVGGSEKMGRQAISRSDAIRTEGAE